MDIDIDWCLTCEKRVLPPNLYCSPECHQRAASGSPFQPQHALLDDNASDDQYDEEDGDDDSALIFHAIDDAPSVSRWSGNDSAGISAWAAQIPTGPPPGPLFSPAADPSSFDSFSAATYRQPPPNLLRPHRRLVPPSLSLASPPSALPPPSTPLELSPRRQASLHSLCPTGNASAGQTSFRTAPTESSLVATPASSHPVPIAHPNRKSSALSDMYSHVRSWVSPSPTTQHPHSLAPPSQQVTFSWQARTALYSPIKVVSSPDSSRGFQDQSTVCWLAGTVVVEQPHAKRPDPSELSRGRKLPAESPYCHDEHPYYRTRGRKASRAAA